MKTVIIENCIAWCLNNPDQLPKEDLQTNYISIPCFVDPEIKFVRFYTTQLVIYYLGGQTKKFDITYKQVQCSEDTATNHKSSIYCMLYFHQYYK